MMRRKRRRNDGGGGTSMGSLWVISVLECHSSRLDPWLALSAAVCRLWAREGDQPTADPAHTHESTGAWD